MTVQEEQASLSGSCRIRSIREVAHKMHDSDSHCLMLRCHLQDQWTQTSRMSMQEARSAFELVKLPNGKVLAVGGRGRSSNMLASSEVFDPTTKTWQAQGSMNEARASFSLVLLSDGKVMAAGGRGDGNTVLNSTEVLMPGLHGMDISRGQLGSFLT